MRPPRLGRWVLSVVLHPDDRDFALADLDEEFQERVEEEGAPLARRWYRDQVARSLVPGLRGRWVPRGAALHRESGNGRQGTMWGLMQEFVSDLRLAGRSLRKAPLVMLITVVSLGFGIGAMTVVFGVAENLLFRGATGIEDPATLVGIYTSEEDAEPDGVSSYRDYRDILAEIDALQDVAAISLRTVGAGDDDAVRPLLAEEVTGNFFSVTGIQPVHGRAFRPEEASIVAPDRVVLISWDLWQREYDGDPGVLGRTLRISGNQHTIIGVVPDEVVSRRSPLEPDLWLPMGSVADEAVTRAALLDQRQWRNLILLGRLADGATQETLDGQLSVLADRLHAEYPDTWQDDSGQPRYFTSLNERDSRLKPGARRLVAGVGGFFLGAAGLILLIACANVTTLFLGRAANRSREMAVRASLGAGRGRLARMLLTEGLIPGLLAGVVGLWVAGQIFAAINRGIAALPLGLPIRMGFGLDGRALVFTLGVSLLASLAFTVLPALKASRPDLGWALKREGGTGGSATRMRDLLVGIQCAASLVLLVGAALFVRATQKATEVDLGLDADRVAIATKRLDMEGLSQAEGIQYIRTLREELLARPDVDAVQIARNMELTLLQMSSEILLEVPGYTPSPEANERYSRNSVTPGYLEMFGVPLLQGRTLSEADGEGAPRVAVINQAFAERFWPGEEVLGRTFFMTLGDRFSEETVGAEPRSFEVVGVVRDGKYFDFDDRPTPYFWTSLYQDYSPRITVTARGVASAAAMIPVLREAIDLAPGEVQMMPPSSLATQLSYQFIHLRVASRVLRWGGIFGLFLAIIGIYGVVSFAVTQRTRDMAIRMAIGAQHNQVLGGVVRDGMRPAVLGLLLGAVLAFLAARAVSVILVGVSPLDPAAFAGGIGLLVTAALVASYLPARRALRIDPMRTLREE